MCGIVGFIGKRNAAPVLIDGLKKLEYRGYDSAGIALLNEGRFTLIRRKGRVSELEGALGDVKGCVGIGHTRWATHGAPCERNAHPHMFGKFAVVHNGIIENYRELKEECVREGDEFSSDTDTEVIAHLLNRYAEEGFFGSVRKTLARLKGSYALAILCSDCPDMIITARKASPLIVGKRGEELFVSSDIPALSGKGITFYPLSDGEIAVLKGKEIAFYDESGGQLRKDGVEIEGGEEIPEIGEYSHFMRKEIGEIPTAILETTAKYLSEKANKSLNIVLCQTEYIQIVACGTAYHSGIAAKYAIEALSRVPVEVCIASEYRYRNPIVNNKTLVVAVSQSGETADTLAAARLAKERGAPLLAIVNVPYSSLTRLADFLIPTVAGTEIGVAATKSYNAQLCAFYLLALELRRVKSEADKKYEPTGEGSAEKDRRKIDLQDGKAVIDGEAFVAREETAQGSAPVIRWSDCKAIAGEVGLRKGRGEESDSDLFNKSAFVSDFVECCSKSGAGETNEQSITRLRKNGEETFAIFRRIPDLCRNVISSSERTKKWAETFSRARSVYFIGRGSDYAAAIEGSLKLKEISYLPSEGYPAGELKHGTLALIGKDAPVVAIMTDPELAEKTMNAVHEVISRGADAFLVTSLSEYASCCEFKDVILIPRCEPIFSPVLSMIPLQMLAYYTALACGNDPDKPRNLAKSVTVE